MYAFIFLGLCYAALTLKTFKLRKKAGDDYDIVEMCLVASWFMASVHVLVWFTIFLGTIE